MLLKDKIVIVSGIGPGLGIELALLAAKEGVTAKAALHHPSGFVCASFELNDGGIRAALSLPTIIFSPL